MQFWSSECFHSNRLRILSASFLSDDLELKMALYVYDESFAFKDLQNLAWQYPEEPCYWKRRPCLFTDLLCLSSDFLSKGRANVWMSGFLKLPLYKNAQKLQIDSDKLGL